LAAAVAAVALVGVGWVGASAPVAAEPPTNGQVLEPDLRPVAPPADTGQDGLVAPDGSQAMPVAPDLGEDSEAFPPGAGTAGEPDPLAEAAQDLDGVGADADPDASPIRVASATDPALLTCVNETLGRPAGQVLDPTDPALAGLTVLSCRQAGIASLDGIEALTGLVELDLFRNDVTDITQLTPLTGLRALELSENPLAGALDPLASLTGLVTLGLAGTGTGDGDLEVLASLVNLEALDLREGGVGDPLGGIAPQAATRLNTVTDLTPISGLISMKKLNVDGLQLGPGGLGALAGMTAMEDLSVVGTGVRALSALTGMVHMRKLNLYANEIRDLGSLAGMIELEHLVVTHNMTEDLSPLAGMEKLVNLQAGGNRIEDLRPLAGLRSLEYLYLTENMITDLDGVEGMVSLEILVAGNNLINDLGPLSGLPRLRNVNLFNNQLEQIRPLATLSALEDLDITQNRVADLTPLEDLPELWRVNFDGNQVADISALASTPKLRAILGAAQRVTFGPAPAGAWQPNPVTGLDGNPVRMNLPLTGTARTVTMGTRNATYRLDAAHATHQQGWIEYGYWEEAGTEFTVEFTGIWTQDATEWVQQAQTPSVSSSGVTGPSGLSRTGPSGLGPLAILGAALVLAGAAMSARRRAVGRR
jgi:internalin A